jgi:peptide chain release factor 2
MRAETQNTLKPSANRCGCWPADGLGDGPHRLEEFNAMIEAPDLWNDPAKAQKLMRERQALLDAVSTYKLIDSGLRDNVELIELGEAEGDQRSWPRPRPRCASWSNWPPQKELEALLDGEADGNDTFLEINAGAGGTESCDWASMLARMYVRWAEKQGYTRSSCSPNRGEEAGIKSVCLQDHRAQCLWLAEVGIGRAPAGADFAL